MEPKLVEIQKFCRWRSAEIMKAMREGREPVPVEPHPTKSSDSDLEATNGPQIDDNDPFSFPDVPKDVHNGIPSHNSFDNMDIPSAPNFGDIPSFPNFDSQGNGPHKSVSNGLPQESVRRSETNPQQSKPQSHQNQPHINQPPQKAPQNFEVKPPNNQQPINNGNGNNGQRRLIKANIPDKKSSVPVSRSVNNNNSYSSSSMELSSEDQDKIVDATKYSRYAVSALLFDDKETAILNLKKALSILTEE